MNKHQHCWAGTGFGAIAIGAMLVTLAQAEDDLRKSPAFSFATPEQGREILTQRDEFIQRLSAFDRAARLKSDKDVTEAAYLEFVAGNVVSWTEKDKGIVGAALSEIWERLGPMSLPWPQPIYLIKTTGNEEGGAPYTRGNAIVLPDGELSQQSAESLRRIISHELFHILTRQNPALKETLYAAIGFVPCGELPFPSRLQPVKISNPDAPRNDHCIRLDVANKQVWAIPILYSKARTYDVSRGGEFFDYLTLRFLVVGATNTGVPSAALYDDADLHLVTAGKASGLFQQVGKNTEYIIHPEEILADNFSLLILGADGVPSPEVLKKMQDILRHTHTAKTGAGENSAGPDIR